MYGPGTGIGSEYWPTQRCQREGWPGYGSATQRIAQSRTWRCRTSGYADCGDQLGTALSFFVFGAFFVGWPALCEGRSLKSDDAGFLSYLGILGGLPGWFFSLDMLRAYTRILLALSPAGLVACFCTIAAGSYNDARGMDDDDADFHVLHVELTKSCAVVVVNFYVLAFLRRLAG